MSVLARTAVRSVRSVAPRAVSVRTMADSFLKKEAAAERDFINKAERDLLKNLLKKVSVAADPNFANTKVDLVAILNKHKVNVTPALVDDLVKWSHH